MHRYGSWIVLCLLLQGLCGRRAPRIEAEEVTGHITTPKAHGEWDDDTVIVAHLVRPDIENTTASASTAVPEAPHTRPNTTKTNPETHSDTLHRHPASKTVRLEAPPLPAAHLEGTVPAVIAPAEAGVHCCSAVSQSALAVCCSSTSSPCCRRLPSKRGPIGRLQERTGTEEAAEIEEVEGASRAEEQDGDAKLTQLETIEKALHVKQKALEAKLKELE